MKKLTSTILFLAFALSFHTPANADGYSDLTAELKQLREIYEEQDYTEENYSLLDEYYYQGIKEISYASSDEEAIYVLNKAANGMISLEHKGGSVEACISIDKAVLNKGFIVEPGFIKVRKYERASVALDEFLNNLYEGVVKNPYSNTGTLESDFLLTGVYEKSGVITENYDMIDVPSYLRKYVGSELNERSDYTRIKKGDYTDDSCFVFSINNKFPNVYASNIPVINDDILRWQFSIYGNGADVGADNFYAKPKLVKAVDKGDLILEFANLYKYDIDSILQNSKNKELFDDAMKIICHSSTTDTAVDRAIDKLRQIDINEVPATIENEEQTNFQEEIIEDSTSGRFLDVPKTHFAYEYISLLSEKGIINGKSETLFCPEDKITRAEFTSLLFRLSNSTTSSNDNIFTDVPKYSWYNKGVYFCYSNGITVGTSATEFSPTALITREDAATMLYRFIEKFNIELTSNELQIFLDEQEISAYAKDSIYKLAAAGIISGRQSRCFDPKETITRAEASKLLFLIYNKIY